MIKNHDKRRHFCNIVLKSFVPKVVPQPWMDPCNWMLIWASIFEHIKTYLSCREHDLNVIEKPYLNGLKVQWHFLIEGGLTWVDWIHKNTYELRWVWFDSFEGAKAHLKAIGLIWMDWRCKNSFEGKTAHLNSNGSDYNKLRVQRDTWNTRVQLISRLLYLNGLNVQRHIWKQ